MCNSSFVTKGEAVDKAMCKNPPSPGLVRQPILARPILPPLLVCMGLIVLAPDCGHAATATGGTKTTMSLSYSTGTATWVMRVDPPEVEAFQLHFQVDDAEINLSNIMSNIREPFLSAGYVIELVGNTFQISGSAGTFTPGDVDIFEVIFEGTGSAPGNQILAGSDKNLSEIKFTAYATGNDYLVSRDSVFPNARTRFSAAEIAATSRSATPGVSPMIWDGDGAFNNGTLGGTGTWNTTLARFDNLPGGIVGTDVAWSNTVNVHDIAVFGGNGGIVTLGADISAGGLQFDSSGYALEIGAGTVLTLSRPASSVPTIDTGANSATVNIPINGSFQKLGRGALTLGTLATIAGPSVGAVLGMVTVKGGTVQTEAVLVDAGDFALLDAYLNAPPSTNVTLAGNGAFEYRAENQTPFDAVLRLPYGALAFTAGDGNVRSTLTTSPGMGTTESGLSFTSLSASAGATGNFVPGLNGAEIFVPGTVNRILSPRLFADGANFAARDAGGFVRALSYGTDANTVATNSLTPGNHVNLNFAFVPVFNSTSWRTLRLGGNTTFGLTAGATLTLTEGGLLKAGGASTIFGGAGSGITTGGSTELIVRTDLPTDDLTISSSILSSSTGGLTKSGQGTLTLSGTNAYTGPTIVNDGKLLVTGSVSSPIALLPEATLGGTGSVSVISGGGTVSPGGNTALPGLGTGILTAVSLNATQETDFRFDVGHTGALYDPSNDLLRLTDPTTPFAVPLCATSRIAFDFQLGSLSNGLTFLGGFFTAVDSTPFLQGAAVVATLNGARVPDGFGVTLNKMVPTSINFGAGLVGGFAAEFRVISPKVLNVNNGPWATGGNWFTPGIPAITDNAVIAATGTIDINGASLGGSTEVQDISFTGTANTTLTNASGTTNMILSLNGGRGTGIPLIKTNANVVSTIAGTGAGGRTLALSLKTSGEIRVEGSSQLNISTIVQESGGAFGLTKTGTGILTMSGANTFTGAMTLNSGTVAVPTVANNGTASPLGDGSSLVFNGGTLEFTGASGTTNRVVTLTGDGTVAIPSISNTLTLTGAISGSGSLIKTGAGTLVLTGVNSYTGPTLILTRSLMASSPGGSALPGNVTLGSSLGDNAFLRMGAANQFGPTSVLTFNHGNAAAKFELLGSNQTVAGLSSDADDVASIIQNEENGNPTLATLTINNTGDHIFNGIIRSFSGGGGAALNLVKNGSGTQEIRNTFADTLNFGTATINAGKLTFNLSGVTGSLGAGTTIFVNAGGQLGLDGTWTMNRPITGAGSVMKLGTGTVTIAGTADNTYTGATTVNAGTLVLNKPQGGGANNFGGAISGALTVSSSATVRLSASSQINDAAVVTLNGGTLDLNGQSETVGGLAVNGGNVIGSASGFLGLFGHVTADASTNSTIAARVNLAVSSPGAARNFTVATGGTLTVSGTVEDGFTGNAANLVKAGAGTLTLAGMNTFTGGVNIMVGTLAAAGGGDQTGRLGQGAVTVNASTTLRSDIGDSFGFFGGAPSVINVLGGTVTTGGAGNFRTTVPSLNLTGGTVTSAGGNTGDGSSGVYSINSGSTVTTNASVTTSTINAPSFGLQSPIVFTVADGSAATDLLVSSALTNVTYGGAAGGVTKAGTGTMTLSGANTYTGATTVNAGTLVLSGSLPNNSAINVNGGTFLVNGSVGAGSLTTVIVGGTVAGTGTINGTLSAAASSIVRVGDIGAGTLTVGTLSFGGAAASPSNVALASTGSVLSRLNVTTMGGLAANGGANSVRLNLSGSTLALGLQVLIDYTGAIGGGGFGGFLLGTLPPRTAAALVNNAGNTSIDLNVTAVDSPVWSGALGSAWSTAVLGPPKNWVLASNNGITTDFLTSDSVLFSDFATTTAVAINGADVTPALIRFNNTTKNYTVTGSNGIAGFLPFTKDGTGTVTLSTTNSFTGPMTLNFGTLSIPTIADGGSPSALGAGSNITFNGGTLQFTGASGSTNRALTLTGAGTISTTTALTLGGQIAGIGGLTKAGTGTLTLTGVNTFTGTTTLSQGNLVLGSAGGTALPGNVTLGTGVQAGIFLIMGAPNQFGPTSVVTFNNGPSRDNKFELRGFNQTVAGIQSDADDTLSIIQNQESGAPPTATLTINNTSNFIFNGLIRTRVGGPLNLVKTGLGTQEIRNVAAAPHAFGTATISAGKLTFNLSGATGTLAATTSVSIAAGATLGLDGTWNMNRDISGAGTVVKQGAGAVTISGAQSYATLQTLAGTTTLTSSLPGATINNTGGILNLNANATNSTVNVSAVTNFGASQTLTALNIGVGAVATLVAAGPSPADDGGGDMNNAGVLDLPEDFLSGEGVLLPAGPAVPEPGSLSLLLLGALSLLRRGKREPLT